MSRDGCAQMGHAPGCQCQVETRQACGCVEDEATGLPVRWCEAHDPRTARLKAAAALTELGAHLDEAGKFLRQCRGPGSIAPYDEAAQELTAAGKAALAAAKAILGGPTA